MKFKQPGDEKARLAPGLQRAEKTKLILMTALAAVLLGVFVYTFRSAQSYRASAAVEDPGLPAPDDVVPEERPYRPEIDRAALERLVSDAEGPDRAELEPEAVEVLMRSARQMTAAAFRDPVIGAVELGAATIPDVLADPAGARGEPFFARGRIEALAPFEGHRLGRLLLEDGSRVHFAVDQMPEGALEGQFVRVNGLFLKVFADRDEESGDWIEAPLLVGREALRSYPVPEPVADPAAAIARALEGVTDDDAFEEGISGLPFDALWGLMAIARELPPDAIDWSAAPVLDRAAMEGLVKDGERFRGQPFRVPISILLGVSERPAGENPARLERFTQGWIGNTTWPRPGLMHFLTPTEYGGFAERDRVVARGIFFKNFAYKPASGGLSVAPVLVLTDLERYVPPSDAALRRIGYVIGGTAIVLLIVLGILLRRDKKSARELQERLLERKRARRGAPTA